MAQRFTENCHKLGLTIHGDFIVGLPGETRETLRNTIDFAKKLDVETIQVSIAHAFPGTEFYDYAKRTTWSASKHGGRRTATSLPNVVYPGIRSRRAGGLGGALLRRILFPSQSRLAHRAQGHSTTTTCRGSTKKRANICSSATRRKKFVKEQKEPPRRCRGPRAAHRKMAAGRREAANPSSARSRVDFKTKLLDGRSSSARNVLGNFCDVLGYEASGRRSGPLAARLYPADLHALGAARNHAADSVAAVAHDAAELGGLELCAAGHFHRLCGERRAGQGIFRRAGHLAALAGNRVHRGRHHFRRADGGRTPPNRRPAQ